MANKHEVSAVKPKDAADPYNPGPVSPLANVRAPVVYDTSKPATIEVDDGYGALVVLWPVSDQPAKGPHGWNGTLYKRVLYATTGAGSITFQPPDPRVIVVDYMDGFEPTPVNLHFYANWFEAHFPGGGPTPGSTPVVT